MFDFLSFGPSIRSILALCALLMDKRTYVSVTDTECKCRYLENAANDESSPIVFDDLTGEFQFRYDDRNPSKLERLRSLFSSEITPQSMLIIFHCPFCGGAAPKSKRHLLFSQISADEEARMVKLLDGIQTIGDAINRLGPPTVDDYSKSMQPETDVTPTKIERHRHIQFHNLSETVDIWFTERSDGTAYWHLQGKYIGQKNGT